MDKLTVGLQCIKQEKSGLFSYCINNKKIISFYGQAILEDGEELDTRRCTLIRTEIKQDSFKIIKKDKDRVDIIEACYQSSKGIQFTQKIKLNENGSIQIQCELTGGSKKEIRVKSMMPLVTEVPDDESPDFLKSLWTKMLLVPYDNTMWVRHEAVPLRPGRTSYDVTTIFDEKSREGLVLGAMDFDTWKNGIICSGNEARVFSACCGVTGMETHDTIEHGIVSGEKVVSSRFILLYGQDYRDLLEQYGEYINNENPVLSWKEGVPFGWNSWSGLAFRLNDQNYREAGRFLREELMPNGYINRQTTYVNLDAGWNKIPEKRLISLVDELHSYGQKAGIYAAPFAWFGQREDDEIPGVKGHYYKEILLKDTNGKLLPRVDGAIPLDVTHPLWKQHISWQAEQFIRWGFDYVKLDFLSHGGMEGKHFNEAIMTGRQAITEGYQFLSEKLSENKAGRPFFISLSIAPLFPCGYGHARRFSCDAFGLAEDMEYILNALTYAWWQSGKLYSYNDPDHISLYQSFCADKSSSFGEARARYTASVIAGTVMMISDDYGMNKDTEELEKISVIEAKERAKKLSCNKEVNRIASVGKSFRPVEAAGTTASDFFTLTHENRKYAALFHWEKEKIIKEFDFKRAGLPENCVLKELWTDKEYQATDGKLIIEFDGCDAALLEIKDVV